MIVESVVRFIIIGDKGLGHNWQFSAKRTFTSAEMKVKIIALLLISSLKMLGLIDGQQSKNTASTTPADKHINEEMLQLTVTLQIIIINV